MENIKGIKTLKRIKRFVNKKKKIIEQKIEDEKQKRKNEKILKIIDECFEYYKYECSVISYYDLKKDNCKEYLSKATCQFLHELETIIQDDIDNETIKDYIYDGLINLIIRFKNHPYDKYILDVVALTNNNIKMIDDYIKEFDIYSMMDKKGSLLLSRVSTNFSFINTETVKHVLEKTINSDIDYLNVHIEDIIKNLITSMAGYNKKEYLERISLFIDYRYELIKKMIEEGKIDEFVNSNKYCETEEDKEQLKLEIYKIVEKYEISKKTYELCVELEKKYRKVCVLDLTEDVIESTIEFFNKIEELIQNNNENRELVVHILKNFSIRFKDWYRSDILNVVLSTNNKTAIDKCIKTIGINFTDKKGVPLLYNTFINSYVHMDILKHVLEKTINSDIDSDLLNKIIKEIIVCLIKEMYYFNEEKSLKIIKKIELLAEYGFWLKEQEIEEVAEHNRFHAFFYTTKEEKKN